MMCLLASRMLNGAKARSLPILTLVLLLYDNSVPSYNPDPSFTDISFLCSLMYWSVDESTVK